MPSRQTHHESARLERRRLPNATSAQRIVECGWGRLIAGHTFSEPQAIADALCDERPGQRDIAYYVDKPHVVISCAPQRLFLNPADAYRLWLDQYVPEAPGRKGFTVRRLQSRADIAAINAVYRSRQMVRVDPSSVWQERAGRAVLYVLAEDDRTGDVLGVAMGVDHAEAFGDDPAEAGASLWALAATPDAPHSGVGETLTRYIAEQFQARGRLFMDLSVVHDNEGAIGLYEKLGFQPIKAFAVKLRNAISAELFSESAEGPHGELGPHGQTVVDEARLRGVRVEVLDGDNGYYRLDHGGRHVVCRGALSELTSAIALRRCANHQVINRLLAAADLHVPAQYALEEADGADAAAVGEFLRSARPLVVRPAQGPLGAGTTLDVRTPAELGPAIAQARSVHPQVLLENQLDGHSVSVLVIQGRMAAAVERRPPVVVGDGEANIGELIQKQSRRREAASAGEASLPLDDEVRRHIAAAGHTLADVLPAGESLAVRRTAWLRTGASVHDVTDRLHTALRIAAEQAARVAEVPVVAVEMIVPAIDGPDYAILALDAEPGFANYPGQPCAERFLQFLFPGIRPAS